METQKRNKEFCMNDNTIFSTFSTTMRGGQSVENLRRGHLIRLTLPNDVSGEFLCLDKERVSGRYLYTFVETRQDHAEEETLIVHIEADPYTQRIHGYNKTCMDKYSVVEKYGVVF